MAVYFDDDFPKFFRELSKNNNREWFQSNKDRFKTKVEKPFHAFVTEVIEELKAINPKIHITAKDAIFRIYKDIRFSKDKTPYKEFISAVVSPGGRKDFSATGLYFELGKDDIKVYSGVYMPDKKQLASIRYYIADHLKEFQKAISDKKFVKRYGEILGDQNKVLPADLKTVANDEKLIYNKNFYYNCNLTKEMLFSPKLVKELLNCYHDALPVNAFFDKAIKAGSD